MQEMIKTIQATFLKQLRCFPADVRASVCGRELGSDGSHLQTAQGEDPGHHRVLQQTVPRIPGTRPQAHPHLPQILPTHEEERHGGTEAAG